MKNMPPPGFRAQERAILRRITCIVVFIGLSASIADACSCKSPPPTCQAFGQSPLIFLGTVTEALETRNGWLALARMRIDKAYKGAPGTSIVLFDDGMCDGPKLEVGEQYLMYTSDVHNGMAPSRGCTRSRHVKYAEEDLKYLDNLQHARPSGTIFGQVGIWEESRAKANELRANVLVELQSAGETRTTTTDGEGRYSFDNLTPGLYNVTASRPGYRIPVQFFTKEPEPVEVGARGCVMVNIGLRKQWAGSVEGHLVRANGTPGPSGTMITLLRIIEKEGIQLPEGIPAAYETTDDEGRYSFREVAPAKYRVVMARRQFPSARVPYPAIYWPNGRRVSEARIIDITDEPTQQKFDFQLPPEPRSLVVDGVVCLANGEPAPDVQVLVVALPDKSVAQDDENRPVSRADGRFSFTAIEGFEYEISATVFAEPAMHTETLKFSLAKGASPMRLVLDRPGRFDGDQSVLPPQLKNKQ